MQDTYREAASLLLLRPAPASHDGYELLLLRKPRKKDAWQLPQGGKEADESAEQCALRELREEAGIAEGDVRVIGKSTHVYQYNFPASFRRFRPDHICGQRIEYVFALTTRDTQVTVDDVEINAYVWIKPSEIGKYVKRKEYFGLIRELLEEAMTKVSTL